MRKKEKNQMAKNYSQYSIDNEVNIIPEEDFKSLIRDTFKVITQHVGGTAGPYGSQVMLSSSDGQSTTTKDGFNSFSALSFMNPYKKMVYLAIKKICERVNNSVGDGTTSCILLGESLFNHLDDVITTPDEKRRLLETISEIESELMNDIEGKPLSDETLFNLVNMTANYDKKLTEKIIEAFAPEYDMYGVVSKIRNVIPEQMRNMDSDETQISLLKIPGDYHVRVFMEPSDASEFEYAREVRIVVYDHAMTEDEWNYLKSNWDRLAKSSAFWNMITDLPSKDELFEHNGVSMNISKSATSGTGVEAEADLYSNLHAAIKCPCKFFLSTLDNTNNPYRNAVLAYKMLVNSGQIAELRWFNGSGHHYDIQDQNLRTNIVNTYGVQLTNIPIVYIEMLQFWRRYEQEN